MPRPAASGRGRRTCAVFMRASVSHDVPRERRDLLRRHVDVQRHVLGGRRDPAVGRVEELLEVVDALGVVVEQLERHAHRIAFVDLAQVAHVGFRREGRVLLRVEIVLTDAEQFVGLVDAAVEQHVVVGHVEVAVVVDPLRLHPHHGGHEGRKEQRFKVSAVEHSNHPGCAIVPHSQRDGRVCVLSGSNKIAHFLAAGGPSAGSPLRGDMVAAFKRDEARARNACGHAAALVEGLHGIVPAMKHQGRGASPAAAGA